LPSKPTSFRTVVNTGKQDLEYIQQTGYGDFIRSIGKLAAVPLIGLAYLAMLPVGFAAALITGGTNLILNGLSGILAKNMSLLIGDPWRHTFPVKEEINLRSCKIAVLV
jgi:hypothetical protein